MKSKSSRAGTHRIGHGSARAFTLIELAVVLVIVGLLAILLVELVPVISERARLDLTRSGIERVDEAVVGFVLANNRLPCPDTDGDGFEGGAGGCAPADVVGELPYKDLDLNGPVLDEAHLPLRYGAYRNASSTADLVTLSEIFEPALPDVLNITPGSVTGCNEVLDPPLLRLVYSNPPVTTLLLSGFSGSFSVDASENEFEFIGFTNVGFSGLTLEEPPPPSAPVPVFFPNCPCGVTNPNSPNAECTTCTGFVVGNGVTSDPSDDSPFGTIQVVSGSTLTLFPSGEFEAGDPLLELYEPPFPGLVSPPRLVIDPEDETSLIPASRLLTGVSATVSSSEGKAARIVEATSLGSGNWELQIDMLPDVPFAPGETVYTADGDRGTVVSQTTVTTRFDDSTPESISGPNGSAVIDAGSDVFSETTGSGNFTVSNVSGTFNGPARPEPDSEDPGTRGDTITGSLSGTTAEVVSFIEDSSSIPVITRGSISFTATSSAQTNGLDFCQSLRHAIDAAGETGNGSFLHTVNPESIPINPAYVMVSGGVEDADGDGLDRSFDQRNEIAPLVLDFESPARLRDSSGPLTAYDDLVAATSMQALAYRLGCARNIGAVNALAVDATVQRNIAEIAFNRNEQALALIELSYRSLELAELDRDIKVVQLILEAFATAVSIYQALEYPEGTGAFLIEAGPAIAALIAAVIDLAVADSAVSSAEDDYAGACEGQVGAALALGQATERAAIALQLAMRADAWGGVQ